MSFQLARLTAAWNSGADASDRMCLKGLESLWFSPVGLRTALPILARDTHRRVQEICRRTQILDVVSEKSSFIYPFRLICSTNVTLFTNPTWILIIYFFLIFGKNVSLTKNVTKIAEEIPFLGIHPKELERGTLEAKTCTQMFRAALLIVAPNLEQPRAHHPVTE